MTSLYQILVIGVIEQQITNKKNAAYVKPYKLCVCVCEYKRVETLLICLNVWEVWISDRRDIVLRVVRWYRRKNREEGEEEK